MIIQLKLLDNCYSFLEEALRKAIESETNVDQWKFAILFLVQAIELLLKELLRREHYFLIYDDIDKSKNTVSLLKAIERLKKIVRLNISDLDIENIKVANQIRNEIVHFQFDINIVEVKLIFAKLFGFFHSLHNSHIEKWLDTIIPEDIWNQALAIQGYSEELYKRAEERMENEGIELENIWVCNSCGWESFVVQDNVDTCYMCGHEEMTIVCEDCNNEIYRSDAEEVEYGDMKRRIFKKLICKECYKKLVDSYDAYKYYGQ